MWQVYLITKSHFLEWDMVVLSGVNKYHLHITGVDLVAADSRESLH